MPPRPGIPLYHAPRTSSLQGYKLLELPDELLALLESDNPPTLTLHPSPSAALLKIPPPTTTGGTGTGKTYSLRQKNTSNALILLEPVHVAGKGAGLRAFATVHETVELVAEEGEVPAAPKRGKWHEKFARGR